MKFTKLISFLVIVQFFFIFPSHASYLDEFRIAYPQYSSWTDRKLLSALWEKYGSCQNKQLFIDETIGRPPQTLLAEQAKQRRSNAIQKQAECSLTTIEKLNSNSASAVEEIKRSCAVLNPIPCEKPGENKIRIEFDDKGYLKK